MRETKASAQLSAFDEYNEGFKDGLRAFAWWKDGTQFVGSCGTMLQQAIDGMVSNPEYAPPAIELSSRQLAEFAKGVDD